MGKNILNILKIIACWCVGIYFAIAFIVIPIVGTWAISWQGSKILQKHVHAGLVTFNPFLWRLNIYGFDIRNQSQEVLVGFKRFTIDVSFLALCQQKYRIESVVLDQLTVNAALKANGQINLLELIPTTTQQPAVQATQAVPPSTQSLELTVDRIQLLKGSVNFIDHTVMPVFKTSLNNMDLNISGFTTLPTGETRIEFNAMLDDKGLMKMETLAKLMQQPLQLDSTFSLNNYAMQVLTPYTGKYTGHSLSDGKLDFKMDYRIENNRLTASHKVLIQKFTFGEKMESKDALKLPFGLAIALLEDPQGRINIALPVKGDMSDPEFEYWHLVGQVVRNFFVKLMTKPFAILASVMGDESGTEELGSVRFLPGKTDVSDQEKQKLTNLVKALMERPKLTLEINGSYDPVIDWKAIKEDVFHQDFNVLKGESTRTETWVYQTLYQRRFGIRALWKLESTFKSQDKSINTDALNMEIKRQLIERDTVDQLALDVLAQTRAKVIYDFIASLGFEQKRLSIGNNRAVQASVGYVPMEFTLTVATSH